MNTAMLWIIFYFAFTQQQPSDSKNFRWLEGLWQNTKSQESFEEWWWNASKQQMEGRGFKVILRDTLVYEKLAVKMHKGAMHYIPIIEENGSPVPYLITKQNAGGFECDNTLYDFPKKITYVNKGGKFDTIVDGNNKKQTFTYKKIR